GKKISGGFALALALLAATVVITYFGVGDVVGNAQQAIGSHELDSRLTRMELDHLNWADRLKAFVSGGDVKNFNFSVDPTKCSFGKWYYGQGRKQAQKMVPKLKPLLVAIEKPHTTLHESAGNIKLIYKRPHPGLMYQLVSTLNQHLEWGNTLNSNLTLETGTFTRHQFVLRNSVQEAISAVQAAESDQSLGSLEAKQKTAMGILRNLRYGPDNRYYFWINDLSPRMLMHPEQKELVGKDLSGFKDPDGKAVFTQILKVVKEKGEGYLAYKWPRGAALKQTPQLAFVKLYEPWKWVVGTSIDLDIRNQALIERAKEFTAGEPFSLGVELEWGNSGLGQFFANAEIWKVAETWPDFKTILNSLEPLAKKMFVTAGRIEKLITRGQPDMAIRMYRTDTLPNFRKIKSLLNIIISKETSLQTAADLANRMYVEEVQPNLLQMQNLLDQIRKKSQEGQVTNKAMLEAAQGLRINVSLVGAVAVVSGILMAFFLVRAIGRTLSGLSVKMGASADMVASSAAQVSNASQSLAEGASEQASSLEETSSSMEEMASMTRQNADNAGQADSMMKEASNIVVKANDSMQQLKQAMEKINSASGETAKIIKTIDEIAFQTNLLALNAAVEAARAGEAGAGFAVVADEVRNLAMRAAEAAKNTSSLIEENLKDIKNGSDLVVTTDEAFTQVQESSTKVAELVGEIAAASSEQAQGIDQVNTAMSEMDRITQQNAANAQESAAASQELNSQSDSMKGLVVSLRSLVGGNGKSRSASSKKGQKKTSRRRLLPWRGRRQETSARAARSQEAPSIEAPKK
ncbi:MAG: methyl-accepting chemotaxis protein, partial [Desulfarculaceae bacterium]